MTQKTKNPKTLWPDNLSDEEFAALQARVKAANPAFVEGLRAIVQAVVEEKQRKAVGDEAELQRHSG